MITEEGEILGRHWDRVGLDTLDRYLVQDVEHPAFNAQSVLIRAFLIDRLFPGEGSELIEEELFLAACCCFTLVGNREGWFPDLYRKVKFGCPDSDLPIFLRPDNRDRLGSRFDLPELYSQLAVCIATGFLAFIFHLAVSLAFGFITYYIAMGSISMHGGAMSVCKVILWIWSPLGKASEILGASPAAWVTSRIKGTSVWSRIGWFQMQRRLPSAFSRMRLRESAAAWRGEWKELGGGHRRARCHWLHPDRLRPRGQSRRGVVAGPDL